MAKLYADQEIRVADKGHVIKITTEPKEVPEFLVDLALSVGAKKAESAPKRSAKRSAAKKTTPAE